MKCQQSRPRGRTGSLRVVAAVVGALCLAAAGCQEVSFHEKEHLADPIMVFDGDATETHFFQKTYYSREGSAGGIGATAGGGCGCY